jgi:DNA-binding MarR family transcriptional regulator
VTHHLTALERAGLILREPDGRRVLAHRTARGTTLLALYEP